MVQKLRLYTGLCVLVLLWLIPYNTGYCAICGNDIVEGFPGPGSENIESSIIEGSSLFFQAAGNIMKVLEEGEKGSKMEINTAESLSLIDAAIGKLKMAAEKYNLAAQVGRSLDSRLCNFTYLKVFAYEKFAAENGLNSEIAAEVKKYLAAGDVTGFYCRLAHEMDLLTGQLNALKMKLSKDNDMSTLVNDYWVILQQTSKTMLLGNYGTIMGKAAYQSTGQ
jgi:hypothetical protein